MSEKIAFLTTAIGLTPGEAQAFWPVYNQMWEERGKAQFNVMKAYKALEAAVDVLAAAGVIDSPDRWKALEYTDASVRMLLIKMAARV